MKTVLVTGGSKRIGKELVYFYAKKGWNVIIHFNSDESVANILIKDLESDFPNQLFFAIQQNFVQGSAAAEKLFEQLKLLNIKVDLLINNASNFLQGTIEETNSEVFDNSFKVNFETPFFLMKNFASTYKEGAVVNILDSRISNNSNLHTAYSLAKKSLFELTKMSAVEFAPKIRVNGVAPGPVLPPNDKDNRYLEKISQLTPLKVPVKLDNLLNSVYFLGANDSITGQVIYCDSGAHLL